MPRAFKKAKRTKKPTGPRTYNTGPRTYRGKKVIDASEPLTFVVTSEDCRKSKPNEPGNCAVANAMKRSLAGHPDVHVHRCCTYVEYPDKVVRYATSSPVRDQTIRFDAGSKFDPGAYRVNPPSASEIAQRGRRHSDPDRVHGDPNSLKRRKRPAHLVGREAFTFTSAD